MTGPYSSNHSQLTGIGGFDILFIIRLNSECIASSSMSRLKKLCKINEHSTAITREVSQVNGMSPIFIILTSAVFMKACKEFHRVALCSCNASIVLSLSASSIGSGGDAEETDISQL